MTPIDSLEGYGLELLKRAYDQVARETGGASFLYIHRIRKVLGWSKQCFDGLLDFAAVKGYVALHPGNPGNLTKEELAGTFIDDYGERYITLSWRRAVI